MEKVNVMSPTTRIGVPIYGIFANARWVSWAPSFWLISGYAIMVLTITRPVRAQTTTVSQKVAVEDTIACLTGFLVWAAAATIGAEPKPDSFENNPLAIPNLAAIITVPPKKPPPAACGENAELMIRFNAGPRNSQFIIRIATHPTT